MTLRTDMLVRICDILVRVCNMLVRVCDVLVRVCDMLVRVCDVLVRVCDVLVPGFEPEARGRDRWRALPQVFRPRASGSEPVGSVLLARSVTK